MQFLARLGLVALIAASAACVVDPDLSTEASESVVANGENLNGENLNGENLNGENLNGSELGTAIEWVELGGARLAGGQPLESVFLWGSQLIAWDRYRFLTGAQLVGAQFSARSDTGSSLTVRVSGVTAPTTGDIWRYRVEYQETNRGWYPICVDATGPFGAIPLAGWWDHRRGHARGGDKRDLLTRITFACPQVGAIGKCVELGYRPWAWTEAGPLDAHHQACVRLMRADYCGDGTSHTVDGSLVNLYDDLGVQLDTQPWTVEAEWDPEGVRCISPHNRSVEQASCYQDRLHETCGNPNGFADGTLLISETPDR